MNIEDALKIAVSAHYGQKDKCGDPYILHPLWVMNQMETEDERVCAILHDVAEDTNVSLKMLREKGLNYVQAVALDLLTHKRGVPYLKYIANLSDNEIARKVKIADLAHNRDADRYCRALENGADEERMNKKQKLYNRAYLGLTRKLPKEWIEKGGAI